MQGMDNRSQTLPLLLRELSTPTSSYSIQLPSHLHMGSELVRTQATQFTTCYLSTKHEVLTAKLWANLNLRKVQ